MDKINPNSIAQIDYCSKEYGVDLLHVRKGQPSNILTKVRYSIDDESDIDIIHTFQLMFIGISKVDQSKPFAVAFFGDNNLNRYEYATASNTIGDIVEVLKNWDQQEAVVEIYNPNSKKIFIFTIYPIDLEYTNESVGLTPKAKNGMKLKKKATLKSLSSKYSEGGSTDSENQYNLLYIPENKLVQQNISEQEVISIVNSMIADPSNLVQSFDDAKVYLEMNGYDLVKKKP